MSSAELIRAIKADGWYQVAQKGSHLQFKHATKAGKVTIPHPAKDIPIGTQNAILKQAGLR